MIAGAFLRPAPEYGLPLRIVIVAAAGIVLAQAANMRRYVWMILFVVVAGLFDPVFPVPFSHYISDLVSTFAIFLFFLSLELLKPKATLSAASTAGRVP